MKITQYFTKTDFFKLITGMTLIISLAASPTIGAENMSLDSERILRSMSSYMTELKAFSMNSDIDFEIITQQGQKLQLSSYATAIIERPAKFHLTRQGMISDSEFFFDGKVFTIYGKNLNVYSQTEITGTLDDAFLAYERETGLSMPGSDLLLSDPFKTLSSGVKSGEYIGTSYINGVECHHLAFRNAKVDWQLWVKAGDQPLPMKYVITTKWVTGAPQYEIRLRDWDLNPNIELDEFSFSAPNGTQKLDTMPIDELDEIISAEEK